jgi:hypothetical protein
MEAVEKETGRLQHLWAAPNNPMGKKFVEMTGADLSKECSAIDLLKTSKHHICSNCRAHRF